MERRLPDRGRPPALPRCPRPPRRRFLGSRGSRGGRRKRGVTGRLSCRAERQQASIELTSLPKLPNSGPQKQANKVTAPPRRPQNGFLERDERETTAAPLGELVRPR